MYRVSASHVSLEATVTGAFVRRRLVGTLLILFFTGKLSASIPAPAAPLPSPAAETAASPSATAAATPHPEIYIQEYRVIGAHKLPQIEVEEAVYPFLG